MFDITFSINVAHMVHPLHISKQLSPELFSEPCRDCVCLTFFHIIGQFLTGEGLTKLQHWCQNIILSIYLSHNLKSIVLFRLPFVNDSVNIFSLPTRHILTLGQVPSASHVDAEGTLFASICDEKGPLIECCTVP